ncbi:MAG: hypothetical protein V1800_14070 [Candidatus Latescibacterota bacterium]
MNNTARIMGCMVLCLLTACASAGKRTPKGNLPSSREATLIESTNPAEVLVLAAGIGEGNNRHLTEDALWDARRAAVYFVLLGGSDPLLQTEEERFRFSGVQEKFFMEKQISRCIAWESDLFESRLVLAKGSKLKIRKHFKINKKLLTQDLSADGILIEIAGPLRVIMVIPEVPKGESPIDRMHADPVLGRAAQVIESYLTARKYDVHVPEQAAALDALGDAVQFERGGEEDYGYRLALSIGSDVYMTYTVQIQERRVGSSIVRKAMVIEEALNDAADKVLSRIHAYWKDDLRWGVQYKLIFSIEGDFDGNEREEIAFAVSDLLEEFCSASKENVMTERTLDYLVWVRADRFETARKLYGALREHFPEKYGKGMLTQRMLNRKLLLLKISAAE